MNKKIMVSLLKDYGLYKSRCVLLEKEIGVMSQLNNMESFNEDAAEKMKSELYELKHKIDKIDTCAGACKGTCTEPCVAVCADTSANSGTIAIAGTTYNSVTLSITEGAGKKIKTLRPNDNTSFEVSISDNEANSGLKTISGLVSNTAYLFSLINATGSSIASVGTTTSPQPGTIAISQTAANSVTLSISQGIGKMIRVFRPNDGSNYDVSITDDEAMTGYKTISGLVSNTAYIFKLINANGVEEASAGTTTLQPEPPVDEDNLKLGSTGAKVTTLQENLNSLGYNCSVNGTFGTETENAVVLFQQLTGVPVTKTTDPDTRSMLATVLYNKNAGWLSKGMISTEIQLFQNNLNTLGYSCGTPDGKFGLSTYNAVYSFQEAQGLDQDGIAGPATMNAINAALTAPIGVIGVVNVTYNSVTLSITNGAGKKVRVTHDNTSTDIPITTAETIAGVKTITELIPDTEYIFELVAVNGYVEASTEKTTLLPGMLGSTSEWYWLNDWYSTVDENYHPTLHTPYGRYLQGINLGDGWYIGEDGLVHTPCGVVIIGVNGL